MHAYANDLQVYLSRPTTEITNICAYINDDLNSIYYWASKNKLSLNPLKSVVLPICKNNVPLNSLSTIRLDH